MGELKILKRVWVIAIDRFAVESSPLAEAHAEQLLDISSAGSVQSLRETREALKTVEEQIMLLLDSTNSDEKGFRHMVAYKRRIEGLEECLRIVVNQVRTYDQRIEANKHNDGRED